MISSLAPTNPARRQIVCPLKSRFLISEALSKDPYAAMMTEERYDFLRTKAIFDRCMEIAYKKWKWVQRRLK